MSSEQRAEPSSSRQLVALCVSDCLCLHSKSCTHLSPLSHPIPWSWIHPSSIHLRPCCAQYYIILTNLEPTRCTVALFYHSTILPIHHHHHHHHHHETHRTTTTLRMCALVLILVLMLMLMLMLMRVPTLHYTTLHSSPPLLLSLSSPTLPTLPSWKCSP